MLIVSVRDRMGFMVIESFAGRSGQYATLFSKNNRRPLFCHGKALQVSSGRTMHMALNVVMAPTGHV